MTQQNNELEVEKEIEFFSHNKNCIADNEVRKAKNALLFAIGYSIFYAVIFFIHKQ